MKTHRYDSRNFAVVTGASSGMGYELAKQFAKNGFDILITGEDSGIEDAAVMLRDECDDGVEVLPVRVNLADSEAVDALYEEIRGVGRPVDAIAINATSGVSGPFAETDLEEELRMVSQNVIATIHLAKLIVQDMIDWGSGRILFTTSITSVVPTPFMAVHAATKAFIFSFSESLREELRDKGITVTAILPGSATHAFPEVEDHDELTDVAREGFDVLMGRAKKPFIPEARAPRI